MNIEKLFSKLPQSTPQYLKTLLSNAKRVLSQDPENLEALRLRQAVEAEIVHQKKAKRMKVGQLWWEPHDPDIPKFLAYESASSDNAVAVIFKHDTHTGSRKDVYSVRVGDHELQKKFSEVAAARQAGSEVWEHRRC